jgi:hypothetical protein
MKKLLMVALLATGIEADLLPPYPTIRIINEVSIENASSFNKDIAIVQCSFQMSGDLICGVMKDNGGISKGYKFNSGPYIFAIKKKVLKKLGGVVALGKEPLLKGITNLLQGGLYSTMGESSSSYERKDATHTKDITTTKVYTIKKIEKGRLYFELKSSTTK